MKCIWGIYCQKFRESNVFTNFKELIWRNILLFLKRHTAVEIAEIYIHTVTFYDKNFVKITFLPKKLLKSCFDEISIGEGKFSNVPHC